MTVPIISKLAKRDRKAKEIYSDVTWNSAAAAKAKKKASQPAANSRKKVSRGKKIVTELDYAVNDDYEGSVTRTLSAATTPYAFPSLLYGRNEPAAANNLTNVIKPVTNNTFSASSNSNNNNAILTKQLQEMETSNKVLQAELKLKDQHVIDSQTIATNAIKVFKEALELGNVKNLTTEILIQTYICFRSKGSHREYKHCWYYYW